MTVSVEVLKQVKDELVSEGLGTAGVRSLIVMRELAAEPDAELAAAIRNAYYNDGRGYPLSDSQDPSQWLRMAAAARAFLQSEVGADLGAPLAEREPRVFTSGPIPEDVKILSAEKDQDYLVRGELGWWWVDPEEASSRVDEDGIGWGELSESNFHSYGPFTEVRP